LGSELVILALKSSGIVQKCNFRFGHPVVLLGKFLGQPLPVFFGSGVQNLSGLVSDFAILPSKWAFLGLGLKCILRLEDLRIGFGSSFFVLDLRVNYLKAFDHVCGL
jgi:hypothetical protein